MEYPISIIKHNQNDVTKLYDSSDPKYEDLRILSEHYYYHKPHNVLHKSLSENYRIIQCLFGVVRVTGPDIEIEISRENKIQLIVHPNVSIQWENISGKAVVTRKECKQSL
jgi:hypothetical protein